MNNNTLEASNSKYSRGLNLREMRSATCVGVSGSRVKVNGGPCPLAHTSWSVALSTPSSTGGEASITCRTVGGRRVGGQSFTSARVRVSVAVEDRGGCPSSTATILATLTAPPSFSRSKGRHSLIPPCWSTRNAPQPPSTWYFTPCCPSWGLTRAQN